MEQPVKLNRRSTIVLPSLYYPIYAAARTRYLNYLSTLSEIADIEIIVKHLGGDTTASIEELTKVASGDALLLSALIDSSASLMRNVLWTIKQTFDIPRGTEKEPSPLEDEMDNLTSLLWDVPNLKVSAVQEFGNTPLSVALEDGIIVLRATRELYVLRGTDHLNALEVNIKTLTGLNVDFVPDYDWMRFRSVRNTGDICTGLMLIGTRHYYRAKGEAVKKAEMDMVTIPKDTVIAILSAIDPQEAF